MPVNLAIFASGSGTNAENIIRYFKGNEFISAELILTNNPSAKVIDRAKNLNKKIVVFSKNDLYKSRKVLQILQDNAIDFIVLAGFLRKIPPHILNAYKSRIVNIHPALLPKFGGKGMYGRRVHTAVLKSGETQSGISIHLVNEKYDEGKILFQKECKVLKSDTPEDLAKRVHDLEYEYYPKIIEAMIRQS